MELVVAVLGIVGVVAVLLGYVVVTTKRGERRFRVALAERPHLRLAGERVRTTLGLQIVSRDTEYELTSTAVPAVRLRPSLLHSHHDPAVHPDLQEHQAFPTEKLLDGWIDDLGWPFRLELVRGTPRDAWQRRYVNGRPELAPQPALAEDVHVRGDAPCPEWARAAILAFLEPGTILCLEPTGTWFQAKRGGRELLDEITVADVEEKLSRADTLRAALRATG